MDALQRSKRVTNSLRSMSIRVKIFSNIVLKKSELRGRERERERERERCKSLVLP